MLTTFNILLNFIKPERNSHVNDFRVEGRPGREDF